MPTLKALQAFVTVVDSGSIGSAARTLFLSQPALSHQMSVLENEVGAPLLERLPRGVRPTAAGAALVEWARSAVTAAERGVAEARSVASGRAGTLRLGSAESMTATLLAPVIRAWRAANADVVLELTELASADALAQAVASGSLDVAITPQPTSFRGHTEVLGREEVIVVVSEDDALASRASLTFAEAARSPLIHFSPENGLAGWLDDVAFENGATLHPVLRTRQAATAAELAASGIGLAFVPVSAVPSSFGGALIHLTPRLYRDVVALTRTPDARVDDFLAVARTHLPLAPAR